MEATHAAQHLFALQVLLAFPSKISYSFSLPTLQDGLTYS
jgi:hypothetical protein